MTLPLERHWKNIGCLLSVEAFWGLSLSLISMVAVLPVFLRQLGATNTVIGVLPIVWLITANFSGLFAAHFTSRLTHRKRAVLLLHVVVAIPYLLLALWFWRAVRPAAWVDILALLLGWGGSWIIMGFTIPVWINFIGKVTRPELRARSFGIIFFFQTLAGAIGGWIGSRVLGVGLPFPTNYAFGFLIAAFCMAAGALFFLPVTEEAGATAEPGRAFSTIVKTSKEILRSRGGIRVYLLVLVLSVGRFLLITYYPVYAEEKFALLPRDSALYTAVFMAGQMCGSIFTGMIGDRYGYSRVAQIAMAALTVGLGLAIFGNHPAFYFVTAFSLGLFFVADVLALFNLSMAFSPHEDNTAYLGIIPALVTPITALVAGSSGSFIDHFGFIPVAWVGLAGAAIALYLVMFHLPEPAYSPARRRAES